MLEFLDHADKALFLFLNGLHSPALDPAMVFITGKWQWTPFYLLLIVLLFKYLERKTVFTFLGILALGITAADRFSSGLVKPLVGRLRPCQAAADLAEPVHNLVHCGQFGFFSSHAANSFTAACVLWMAGRRAGYGKSAAGLLFPWAILVSYSRIYVGVHYPADILIGALSGIFWGFLFCGLARRFGFLTRDSK